MAHSSCSFLLGLGALDWEVSTSATLALALAGATVGGALGGGDTRLETDGQLAQKIGLYLIPLLGWLDGPRFLSSAGCQQFFASRARLRWALSFSQGIYLGVSPLFVLVFLGGLLLGCYLPAARDPQCLSTQQANPQATQSSLLRKPRPTRRCQVSAPTEVTPEADTPFDRGRKSVVLPPGPQNDGTYRKLGEGLHPLPSTPTLSPDAAVEETPALSLFMGAFYHIYIYICAVKRNQAAPTCSYKASHAYRHHSCSNVQVPFSQAWLGAFVSSCGGFLRAKLAKQDAAALLT